MLVKEWIFTSLMILMEKKEFQKITITDITNKAGVSRMAFYRNYSVKEDIITDYLDKLFQMYLAELSEYTQIDVYQFAYKFFAYFRKHRKLIQNLNKAELSVLLLKRFDLYLNSIFEDIFHSSFEITNQYEIHFVAGGLYKILIEWIDNGAEESDDEMAKIVSKLAKDNSKTK
jgi:Transcriptional regulator